MPLLERLALRPPRRTASWLLFLAVLAHNAEEGLTYPAARGEATQLLRRIWPQIELPAPILAQAALVLVTAAVGAWLAWAARTHRDRAGWLALKLVAAVLLVNVLAPHVPAAILLGGYAPGVATALAVNLPLGLWVLARRREPAVARA